MMVKIEQWFLFIIDNHFPAFWLPCIATGGITPIASQVVIYSHLKTCNWPPSSETYFHINHCTHYLSWHRPLCQECTQYSRCSSTPSSFPTWPTTSHLTGIFIQVGMIMRLRVIIMIWWSFSLIKIRIIWYIWSGSGYCSNHISLWQLW